MVLTKSKIFLILCLSFILGVWVGRYINIEIMAIIAMLFIFIATLGWQSRSAKVIGFAGLILILGAMRIYFSLDSNQLSQFYGQKQEITGIIVSEPDVRSDKTYLTLDQLEISGQSIDSKILATIARFPEYSYGDQIKFTAKIEEPKDAETKGEFSYKNYLSKSGIEAVVYYPNIEKTTSDRGNPAKAAIFKFKQKFVSAIAEILPEPQNSFLAGLLVGLRRGIPDSLLENFNATGTTHIIALSGFNITIIATFIDLLLLNWFNRRISFILSIISIVLFVILSGASASVVRAAAMGILAMLALNIGRVKVVANALALTGAVMLLLNPQILHFDIGFQLSFLALVGLIYLSPLLEPYFSWLWQPARTILLATLSAQILVLPVLLLNFDRLSLVAPLTNLLVLPVIPFAMLFGFLAAMAGMIWEVLALPFAWIAWGMLEYVILVVEATARIPLASITYEDFSIIILTLYYLVLFIMLLKYYYPEIWNRLLRRQALPGLLANLPILVESAKQSKDGLDGPRY